MAALPDHPIRRPLPGQDLKKQESVLDDKTSALHVHPPHERRIYSQYLAPGSAYLSAGNLLRSQILSAATTGWKPPKGARKAASVPHLARGEQIRVWASVINLGR